MTESKGNGHPELIPQTAGGSLLRTKTETLSLAKLKASDMCEWPGFIDVECDSVIYRVGYKPKAREYIAKAPTGDIFEASSLPSLKDQLKSDAAPTVYEPVTVGGETVGHIMNQINEFFYRPIGTKVIGEKFDDSEPLRESLRAQGMKLD